MCFQSVRSTVCRTEHHEEREQRRTRDEGHDPVPPECALHQCPQSLFFGRVRDLGEVVVVGRERGVLFVASTWRANCASARIFSSYSVRAFSWCSVIFSAFSSAYHPKTPSTAKAGHSMA